LSIRDKLYLVYDFKDTRCDEIIKCMKKINNRISGEIDLYSFHVTEKILKNSENNENSEEMFLCK
jgi:hypothetical protein